MHQFTRASLLILLVAFICPATAAAQPPAGSFDDLSRLPRPGDLVKVQEHTIAKSEISRVSQADNEDSVANGVAIGALAGAGTMFAVTKAMYAACNENCDAPAPAPMYAASMGLGAGVGAVAGWIIDKLRKGTKQVSPIAPSRPAIGVTPVVTPRARGVVVGVAF